MTRIILIYFCVCFLNTLAGQTPLDAESNMESKQYIFQIPKTINIDAIFTKEILSSRTNQASPTYRQIMDEPLNLWLVDLTANDEATIQSLRNNKYVISATKNRAITPRATPDDLLFSSQWQYKNNETEGNDLDILRAWDITTGGLTPSGDTIVICVIDDGVNGDHQDLIGNMWINYNEIPDNGIDDDNNGYVDDYLGWNVRNNNDDVYSNGGHGTPVVGIVGAKGNNNIGVSGVNWNVKIMMINYGSATEANALSSYAYAYKMRKLYNETNGQKGAFIVATNASWGIDKTKAEEAPLWCALYDSLGHVGILNCGATANSNVDVDFEGDMPTSCESEFLISVTNINKSDSKVGAAGYGKKSIDLGAYGQGVFTLTRNDYGAFGGTSGATPHVTGVVGLLYATPCPVFDSIYHYSPSSAALIAKDMILNGATKIPSLQGITTTGGKLNVFRAVSNLKSICENCSPPAGISISPMDESLSVSWVSGTEQNLNLRYRRSDELGWKVITDFKNGDTIVNLNHCTEYEMQLSSQCGFMPDIYGYSKYFRTGGCCTKPNLVDLIGRESSVHIEWSNTVPSIYLLQYKEGQGPWIDSLISGQKFELRDLPECTAYQFRLKSECIKYGEFSDFTLPYNISTSCGNCTELKYCGFGQKDVSDEWIQSITLDGKEFVSGPSEQGYKNFAGLTDFEFDAGSSYSFVIKAGYSSSSYRDYYKILLDVNQDGQWSEDEMLFETPISVRDSAMGEIKIPLDAKDGYTRMRFIISYDNFAGGCDDSKFEYGEVEDYCVFIKPEECRNEVISKLVSTSDSTLKFSVTYPDNKPEKVKISYRPFGTSEWQTVTGVDTILINGLEKCTLYEYQYYGFCGARLSEGSTPDTIRTSCINSVIDYQAHITISPNPSSGSIQIDASSDVLINASLKISNSQGIQLMQGKILENPYYLDISHLISGVYIIDISEQNGKKYLYKLIKI